MRNLVSHPVALVAALALLVADNLLANRVLTAGWTYPAAGVALTLALLLLARAAGLSRAQLGLGNLRRSGAVGLLGVLGVAVVFAVALLIPDIAVVFHDQRAAHLTGPELAWAALIRVPLGTVLVEEVAFRGVLPALLGGGESWHWPAVLGASGLFALWHVLPAANLAQRNALMGELFGAAAPGIALAVALAGAMLAGLALCVWRYLGRGILASVLVHIATNSGGYLVAWWVSHWA